MDECMADGGDRKACIDRCGPECGVPGDMAKSDWWDWIASFFSDDGPEVRTDCPAATLSECREQRTQCRVDRRDWDHSDPVCHQRHVECHECVRNRR